MLTAYIEAAMHHATYEVLPDDEGIFGSIPDLDGLWAHAETQEACEGELRDALEGWILLGIYLHHKLPIVDGIDLNISEVAA